MPIDPHPDVIFFGQNFALAVQGLAAVAVAQALGTIYRTDQVLVRQDALASSSTVKEQFLEPLFDLENHGVDYRAGGRWVLTTARIRVWMWRSTLGLDDPPFSSPQSTATSVPSTAWAASSIASENQDRTLAV